MFKMVGNGQSNYIDILAHGKTKFQPWTKNNNINNPKIK